MGIVLIVISAVIGYFLAGTALVFVLNWLDSFSNDFRNNDPDEKDIWMVIGIWPILLLIGIFIVPSKAVVILVKKQRDYLKKKRYGTEPPLSERELYAKIRSLEQEIADLVLLKK